MVISTTCRARQINQMSGMEGDGQCTHASGDLLGPLRLNCTFQCCVHCSKSVCWSCIIAFLSNFLYPYKFVVTIDAQKLHKVQINIINIVHITHVLCSEVLSTHPHLTTCLLAWRVSFIWPKCSVPIWSIIRYSVGLVCVNGIKFCRF